MSRANGRGLLPDVYQEVVEAERELRSMAEKQIQELRAVLTEVAMRFAGTRLEARRREDPLAPDRWTAAEWRAFWASLPRRPRSEEAWLGEAELTRRLRQAEARAAAAEARVEELRQLLRSAQQEPDAEPEAEAPPPKERAPLPAPRVTWPPVPARPPARFAAGLSPGAKGWRRQAWFLYLVGVQGWSLWFEVLTAIAAAEGVTPRTGSLRRACDDLIEAGHVGTVNLKLHLGSTNTNLKVVWLTPRGRELCGELGWGTVEGEWERLVRQHDGERQRRHAAAVLLFARHARLRGWRVEVTPRQRQDGFQPDALVTRGEERIYVEVERGSGSEAKWRNMAAAQGRVGLCAVSAARRAQLVADCRALGLHGVATDLETLTLAEEVGELWLERW